MGHAEGATIAGKYELIQQIGRGGMATVYRARHIQLGVPVAVKLLHSAVNAPGAAARFEREARAAASLRSPHIVQVQDFGVDQGDQYLVMELLDGEPLSKRLKALQRLSLQQADDILKQIVKGLSKAHDAGIIHRDLKPDNIFLALEDGREVVKIVDFGIAKHARSEDGPTDTGDIVGTVEYSSPEQIRGESDLDTRTDVWSIGVILFRALTGKLPFRGTNQTGTILSVISDPLPAMAAAAPDLPRALDAFFGRALAKNRQLRFTTILDLAEAFSIVAAASPAASVRPFIEERASPALDPESRTLRRPLPPPATPGGAFINEPGAGQRPTAPVSAAAVMDARSPSSPTFEPQAISIAIGADRSAMPGSLAPASPPAPSVHRFVNDPSSGAHHPPAAPSATPVARKTSLLIGAAIGAVAALGLGAAILLRRAAPVGAIAASQDTAATQTSGAAPDDGSTATARPAPAPEGTATAQRDAGAPSPSLKAAAPVPPPARPGAAATASSTAVTAAGQGKSPPKATAARESPMCNEQAFRAKLNECHANLDVACAEGARAAHAACPPSR